ncbi:MAG: redoxin domain-containing protein [Verrucomicrobiota bacterium]
MALSVGDKAPDFTLTTLGESGPELFTLSQNTGESNIVLLFVPMAFTGVCTEEFCAVSANMDEYDGLNAQVIGISGDNPFAQQAWAEKEGFGLKLLSDYEHEVTQAYGVAYEAFLPDKNLTMGGVPKRSAFIIDREGVIQYAESSDNPGQLPDFDAIKAKLGELA